MTEEQESYEAEELTLEAMMPEAPASLNLRFASQHGFECQLTVRSFDEKKGGLTLLGKLKAMEESLHKKGCKPIFGKNSQAQAKAPAPEAEADPHPLQKPCPIHGVMMDRRESKSGGYFYSHQLGKGPDGKTIWCNGRE
jgi:hypothetical protein